MDYYLGQMARCRRHAYSKRLTSLVMSTFASLAWGQQGGDPASGASAQAQLPEVIVTDTRFKDAYTLPNASTATKTDTPLMETPVTIEVIPQQILRDQFTQSLDQTLMSVGVFSIGYEPLSENYFMRGFQNAQTMWNGFRIDDAASGASGGFTVGGVWMDNVDKVEVTKGPASILYGRVEPGGMVNVVTKQPTDHFFGEVAASYGSWNDQWYAVDAGGPLNIDRTLLYRLNASEESSRSWFLWGPEYRSVAISPVLEWRPSPQTSVSLEGLLRRLQGYSVSAAAVPLVPNTNTLLNANPALGALPENSGTFDISRFYTALNHKFDDDWKLTWKLLHTLSNTPLTTFVFAQDEAYPSTTPNTLPIDRFLDANFPIRNRTDATILDLTGHLSLYSTRHTLLAGGDY